ncbi:hypothetical protein CCMSSC00406_0006841 [Pleurotus cornucopiae]|uniref:Uncharacterized protein n=1 Tax=Pleurotus cornucopiae TaxID=5321 RepID=A0ACB7J4C4_PLECO|nr:hypothetical protein CCMSSC00406_0006841 [Pleurotus cornucopiae]
MDGMHGRKKDCLTSATLFTMRAALFLLAFAAVFVVASPSSDKGKKKKPAAPAADPAASTDAPTDTV